MLFVVYVSDVIFLYSFVVTRCVASFFALSAYIVLFVFFIVIMFLIVVMYVIGLLIVLYVYVGDLFFSMC